MIRAVRTGAGRHLRLIWTKGLIEDARTLRLELLIGDQAVVMQALQLAQALRSGSATARGIRTHLALERIVRLSPGG